VIAADWREVAASGLPHHGAVVRCNEYGLTAGGDRERSMPICEIRRVTALDVYLSTVTTRQASELVNIQSTFSHLCQRTQQSSNPRRTSATAPSTVAQDLLPAALSATTSEPSPQKAGSDWVWNCSASRKYPFRPSVAKASANTCRPSGRRTQSHQMEGAPIQRLHMLHPINKTRICPGPVKRPLRLGPYRATTKSMKARTFAAGKWRDG